MVVSSVSVLLKFHTSHLRSSMRHVFFTTIKPSKMGEYLDYHDNIWPEVAAGLRQAGVTQLHIYRVPQTSNLVMTIETAGVDLTEATGPGSLYRTDPVCEKWESMMDADFHGGWTELLQVHSSEIEWNKALALPLETRFYNTRPTEATAGLFGLSGDEAIATSVEIPSSTSRAYFVGGVLCGVVVLEIARRAMSK